MANRARHSRICPAFALLGLLALGCAQEPAPPHEQPKWPTLPNAAVPDFMHETLFERVRFTETAPMAVYGYSLVVNLHDTGDSTASSGVRQYIERQILKRGFDTTQHEAYQHVDPEMILSDKRVAIVEVEGIIPVGARAGQLIDINIRAMPGGHTKSLAHGELYQTDLSDHGLIDPEGIETRVAVAAQGGQVFVNPAYDLTDSATTNPSVRESLLTGVVLNAGLIARDRPILLELRQPQASTARRIEELIQHRWQDDAAALYHSGVNAGPGVANAVDEGLVEIYVPLTYRGDWKHFLGVVSHLYLDDSEAFTTAKAQQLVDLAHQPGVSLADISLCWEAMGQTALPIFQPLISDPDPNVAFAAARAAAYCGDIPARYALLQMASDSTQPNQLDAVKVLGELPSSSDTNRMLRQLLRSDKADIRIAAYNILVNQGDESGIETHQVGDRFFLDIVHTNTPPMVYATNTGVPRIALFGDNLTVQSPITFAAMDYRLTISSSDGTDLLTLFYRDPQAGQPINVLSHSDLGEIVTRLGGVGAPGEDVLNLSYGDVVAVLQQLVQQNLVRGATPEGQPLACTFQLEHPQLESDTWTSIPSDTMAGRPQGSAALSTAGPMPSTMPTASAAHTGG
ncbi:MAG: flagellar basal body P-ring protein FlgI [Tepidisphaeraceae bacterium]|jgi:hypothetical protein